MLHTHTHIFDFRLQTLRPLKKGIRVMPRPPRLPACHFFLAAANDYYKEFKTITTKKIKPKLSNFSALPPLLLLFQHKKIKKNITIMWYKPFFCYNLSLLFSQILSPKTLSFPSTLPILCNDIVSNRHYLSISLCFVLIFKLCFARQFIMRVIMSKKIWKHDKRVSYIKPFVYNYKMTYYYYLLLIADIWENFMDWIIQRYPVRN